jgi:hypothetical protein
MAMAGHLPLPALPLPLPSYKADVEPLLLPTEPLSPRSRSALRTTPPLAGASPVPRPVVHTLAGPSALVPGHLDRAPSLPNVEPPCSLSLPRQVPCA